MIKENSHRIRKLDESTINKIAAGEVIQSPVNAIKELIENSLDADSKKINVNVKDSGLKMIQIQDDGTGINKDDLKIVCERFTTSKITMLQDLFSLDSYGFRGEAMASLSQVAYVSIISKCKDSTCAFKCEYINGKPKSQPKGQAGNQGTVITIEDLFYNLPIRKNALKNGSTYNLSEYLKIYDLIAKYAIHNSTVSFTLKHINPISPGNTDSSIIKDDLKTFGGALVTPIETISMIYGKQLADKLTPVNLDETEKYKFSLNGYFLHPQHLTSLTNNKNQGTNLPKNTFALFINHRLVKCVDLKKAIDTIYQSCVCDSLSRSKFLNSNIFTSNDNNGTDNSNNSIVSQNISSLLLSKKPSKDNNMHGGFKIPRSLQYFAYLDLRVPSQNIDVNVHPTKEQVCFLHQDIIIAKIRSAVYSAFFPNDLNNTKSDIKSDLTLPTSKAKNEIDSNYWNMESQKNDDGNKKINIMDSSLFNLSQNSSTKTIILSENSPTLSHSDIMSCLKSNRFVGENDKTTSTPSNYQWKQPKLDTILPVKTDQLNSVKVSSSDSVCNNKYGARNDHLSQKLIHLWSPKSSLITNTPLSKRKKTHSINGNDQPVEQFAQIDYQLSSVAELKHLFYNEYKESELTRIIREHVYVGVVLTHTTYALLLFQYKTGLYIAHFSQLCIPLYYETLLTNFGCLNTSPPIDWKGKPLSLYDLSILSLSNPDRTGWDETSHGSKEKLATCVEKLLISKAEMLEEYFAFCLKPIEIGTNTLGSNHHYIHAIPEMIPGEMDIYLKNDKIALPDLLMEEFSYLILSLAVDVDWENEQNCFHGFMSVYSKFWASRWDMLSPNESIAEQNEPYLMDCIEKVLLPHMKRHITLVDFDYINMTQQGEDGIVKTCKANDVFDKNNMFKITEVEELYSYFERC